jgi:general secretion pathway protein I
MRAPDAGFTLIESLVALAVLAVSAVSLLVAVEAHVRRIGELEARALAQFAAEDRLALLELGLVPAADEVEVLGRRFEIAEARAPTDDPDLASVELAVTERHTGRTYRGFVGFIDGGRP